MADALRVTLVVDALRPPLTGIGRYTWELSQRLPRQPGIERVDFFGWGRFLDEPAAVVRGDKLPRPWAPRWVRRRLPNRRLDSSIVHGPNYFLPPEAASGIITVHDLSVFRYPETHPRERLKSFEREFLSSLSRARHIITDTETVRNELAADFSIPLDRISAVPLGVDGSTYRPRAGSELAPLTALGLAPGAYALCVSTFEPRKRVIELIRAWGRLPERIRGTVPLVIAGAKGWLNESIHREIDAGIAGGWLKHLGFVADETLPLLYSGAALFIYPSIYEGFGLPPLEAMASGVPVLVSDRSCFPEVCSDAAGYIDPDDLDGFATSIAAALDDAEWRGQARARGLIRAASYSWDECAARTADVYRKVWA